MLKDGGTTIIREDWVPKNREAAGVTLDSTNLHSIAVTRKLLLD